ncbi:endoribonuclease l-psp family protein [Colletotrichum karsti]|uniref:Endoribonuclease l-psp family protein n=1 Tax=Colletotrichum karsti TaxID=1095194 RepID=A0A9P6IFN1_9PEZI|nr:endoribonuclease l-psp family protein [Colletotrichum karsti]KAF9881542.1 endoribonuclease l-psp family protein [Colletotrichum karsti]
MPDQIQYRWLPGPVGDMLRSSSLATTATIPLQGHLVITTGHIGVDLKTGELVKSNIRDEFNAVIDCLDAALRDAGVEKGVGSAHKFVAYFVRAEDEVTMLEIFRERYPGHSPTWTSVVVAGLVVPEMHVELQAEAIRHN